ncbi:tyrosine-type recombinase/integrase [Roseicyclus marinus]|uniref:tyrosine-type recombinase/integrase n=1 Tax=Roseicyclus marinus TaxID=2161673 RepID=UPI002410A8A8|nr:tyrosine-type recombinase/integrase [Roseicyclus marinus]MDG3043119.1 tyrosine-type recombinase/integrase [Roseicyclus marinus]
MLNEIAGDPVDQTRARTLLQEMVRAAVARMLADLEAPACPDHNDDRLAAIRAELADIRTALKLRDWSGAAAAARGAADTVGLDDAALSDPGLARQVLVTRKRLLDLEAQVEETFDDPLQLGRDLLADHVLKPTREGLQPPMTLSEATRKALADAPSSVERKIQVVGDLAVAVFGDIPVKSLHQQGVMDFFEFVWWLPKNHGKAHGKNRFKREGKTLCPKAERAQADARDAEVIASILADETLSKPDRRRLLAEQLTPRLTDTYVVVLRDMFQRIVKAALGARAVGRDLDDDERIVPTQKALRRKMALWWKSAKTPCGLPTRVSTPKRRRSWSLEHLGQWLTSPIYTGSASRKQRIRPASGARRVIVRDALYWVPLILVTMGMRPEEVLQLQTKNVLLRDGIFCLSIENRTKTEQSRRILPVPELLIQLGFMDWVRQKRRRGDVWLFPEIPEDASHGKRSQIFGDRMRTKLKSLKIHCGQEDIYAMRRTLSSKLLHAGADTGVRQRILGHLEGTTVDMHYSDDGLRELKEILDAIDYGVVVAHDRNMGFPVVVACRHTSLPPAEICVALQADGCVAAIEVTLADSGESILAARIESTKLADSHELAAAPVRGLEDVAADLERLFREYDLLMPSDTDTAQAVEHLLIFAPPRTDHDCGNIVAAGQGRPTVSEKAGAEDASGASSVSNVSTDSGTPRAGVGDIVLTSYLGQRPRVAKPGGHLGLVVGEKTLGARRFLDLAHVTTDDREIRAYHLVLASHDQLREIGIDSPAIFDMRKRVLLEVGDTNVTTPRVACLPSTIMARMREALVAAGDVAPRPMSDEH